jgi:hypothetical protein
VHHQHTGVVVHVREPLHVAVDALIRKFPVLEELQIAMKLIMEDNELYFLSRVDVTLLIRDTYLLLKI